MKRIEIKLSQQVVSPLLDFLKPVVRELGSSLALDPVFPEGEDSSFEETWRGDLLASQSGDVSSFLELFDREFVEDGTIRIDDDSADFVLRAAAAIRLHLRARWLRDVPGEILEKGELAYDSLSPDSRQAYASYLFLATIQEIVIQHLEPAGGR